MNRTYGRVMLDPWSIGMLKAAAARTLSETAANISNTNDQDEIVFYRTTSEWIDKLHVKLTGARQGRIGFTEQELRGLKGMISQTKSGMLREYQTATIHTDAHRAAELSEELALIEKLEASLDKPFVNDRSHDAEAEEEDEEDLDEMNEENAGARP